MTDATIACNKFKPGNRRIRVGMQTFIDVSGQRFGRLIAVRHDGRDGRGEPVFLCVCDCGKSRRVLSSRLRGGFIQSCGCWYPPRKQYRKHGHTVRGKWSQEYRAWHDAKQRCENPNDKSYKNFGGRGIKLCLRWQKAENFLIDMGPKPHPKHLYSLSLIDGARDFRPGNCRWALRRPAQSGTR
jgi:hypothetical protein